MLSTANALYFMLPAGLRVLSMSLVAWRFYFLNVDTGGIWLINENVSLAPEPKDAQSYSGQLVVANSHSETTLFVSTSNPYLYFWLLQ
jgi:hypothetical protein